MVMKKYFLETLSVGCPKNILESASYRKVLDDNGFLGVETLDEADVVVLNTCGCLQTLQDKAKSAINNAVSKQLQNNKKIIVAGCYPLIDKDNNLAEQKIETFPPGEIAEFKKILKIEDGVVSKEQESNNLFANDLNKQPKFVTKPSSYFKLLNRLEKLIGYKIQPLHNFFKSIMMSSEYHYVILGKGCNGNCTFCGIKLAIGNPVSRSMNEIVNNVRKGIVNGKTDVWLVADDVGCWGEDIGSNSALLLKEILLIPSPMKLVINYYEPEMFLKYFEQLKDSLGDPRIIQICIPLQTGSQSLLRKMGRHYNIKEVLTKIKEIKKANPQLIVKSQYITTFPGETWTDFFHTVLSMRAFDGIGVNSYARLKFTAAYNLMPHSKAMEKLRKRLSTMTVTLYHLSFLIKSCFRISLDPYKRGTKL